MGELLYGTQSEVQSKVEQNEVKTGYVNLTWSLPEVLPKECIVKTIHEDCPTCNDIRSWDTRYQETVDNLIVRSNVHDCERYMNKDGTVSRKKTYTGCKENKYNKCKARFPRQTFMETQVDPETGAI